MQSEAIGLSRSASKARPKREASSAVDDDDRDQHERGRGDLVELDLLHPLHRHVEKRQDVRESRQSNEERASRT